MSNTPHSFARKNIVISVTIGMLLVVAIIAFWIHSREKARPDDARNYPQMVSAFFAGVTALEVGDNPRAKERLTVATQLIPTEPAAWADLGLYFLREGNFTAAAENFDRALSMAPSSSAIEVLYGLLESRRGDFDKSIAHLQRAVQNDPQDARARYALANVMERRGGEKGEPEIERQLEELTRLRPTNLVILLDAARSKAKRGDAAGLRGLLHKITPLSAQWSDSAKTQLKAVLKAAEAENVRPAATTLIFLRNALLPGRQFQRDMAGITTSDIKVGEPIQRFMKLPSPSPNPSPHDGEVKFSPIPLAIGGTGWTCAISAWLKADGPPVAFVANGHEVRRADGQGAAIPFPGGTTSSPPGPDGVLAVDWKNKYASGLVLAGAGGVRLMQPAVDGAFTDVTSATIEDAVIREGDYVGVWAADIDLDGDLDVVLAARTGPPAVLRNNGDGTFKSIPLFENISGLRQFVWTDLDGDGVPDAGLLDDRGNLTVLTNDRGLQFHPRPVPAEVRNVVSIATADITRSGKSDLIALLADGSVMRVYDDGGPDLKAKAVVPPQPTLKAMRLTIADVDNNGAVDLIIAGEKETVVFLGTTDGTFFQAARPIAGRVFSVAVDATRPSGLRLLGVKANGEPIDVSPQGNKGYHYQIVRPRALASTLTELKGGQNKINTFAIGGQLEMRAALLYQSQSINGGATHFGLGDNAGTDVLRILWPNGNVQAEFNLKPDQAMTADQRLKGSCPMLFTYDGKGMQFVTDLIWRSPLGLRINAQNTASVMQTEDWVKIRGDQLSLRDGTYDLRVTAELWETHFFDHISLMSVDHPQGTEVFVDERFAIPPPPLKIYLTTPPRPFLRATDEHGNDVSDVVRARDGKYLDSFARGEFQGVAADHWVELELDPGQPLNQPLVLIGSGWIHPTDSSINVAMAQGHHPAPAGLSIEVPDDKGGWKVARNSLGFPAGKNKSIVLRIDDLFAPGIPRKLRLRTNLEVYWDSLAFAKLLDSSGDNPATQSKLLTQRLPMQRADLQYRGFSLIAAANASSPELPFYDQLVGSVPRWLDLTGFYTRYGDVRELLEKVDDRYVIMNAGDEMRLRFTPAAPPTNGLIRDFVLIADGWVKDGDYNTAYSKTVLPLPRHDWPNYDAAPGNLEDDPAYQRHPQDWLNYHTRYVTPDAFRKALSPN